jgi:hypothetical protein
MPDVKGIDPEIATKIFMQAQEGDLCLARLETDLEVPMGVSRRTGLLGEEREPRDSAISGAEKGSENHSILSKKLVV